MADKNWLSLTEYSSKYKVSISTLRRRIKSKKIGFQAREGKYYLADGPLAELKLTQNKVPHEAAQVSTPKETTTTLGTSETCAVKDSPELKKMDVQMAEQQAVENSSIWVTANNLLAELKSAYVLILQEKEESLLQLKEEVADLKTLVRILESENARLSEASAKSSKQNTLQEEDEIESIEPLEMVESKIKKQAKPAFSMDQSVRTLDLGFGDDYTKWLEDL